MQAQLLYRVTHECAGRAARAIGLSASALCSQASLPPIDDVPEPTPFWERKIGMRFARMDVNKVRRHVSADRSSRVPLTRSIERLPPACAGCTLPDLPPHCAMAHNIDLVCLCASRSGSWDSSNAERCTPSIASHRSAHCRMVSLIWMISSASWAPSPVIFLRALRTSCGKFLNRAGLGYAHG